MTTTQEKETLSNSQIGLGDGWRWSESVTFLGHGHSPLAALRSSALRLFYEGLALVTPCGLALCGREGLNWSYYVGSLFGKNKCLSSAGGKRRKQDVEIFLSRVFCEARFLGGFVAGLA